MPRKPKSPAAPKITANPTLSKADRNRLGVNSTKPLVVPITDLFGLTDMGNPQVGVSLAPHQINDLRIAAESRGGDEGRTLSVLLDTWEHATNQKDPSEFAREVRNTIEGAAMSDDSFREIVESYPEEIEDQAFELASDLAEALGLKSEMGLSNPEALTPEVKAVIERHEKNMREALKICRKRLADQLYMERSRTYDVLTTIAGACEDLDGETAPDVGDYAKRYEDL